ncbi:hypothetical protein MKW98_018148 [Papaver atlanticum]|uniref:Uncharacterized protein n=1 Tax=Papaver atlanticum TaxID=357466 RepID=A0AAD4XAX9_9MAGN|nr:hypothetical protein MKW98_018148 [Papaver atlanticum]
MDKFSSCDDMVSEYLSSRNELKQSYVSGKQFTSKKNGTSEVTELGAAFSKILNVKGTPLPVPGCIQPSDLNEKCHLGPGEFCEDSDKQDDKLSVKSNQKMMSKPIDIPVSRKTLSCFVSNSDIEGTSCPELHGNASTLLSRFCSRSLSLPNSPNSVRSAMKGSREQQGVQPPEKLTVKWASDVYDPPSTTVSHTVRSYIQQQRYSSKYNNKKHGKHKQKGKHSRGSNNTDKKQQRKSTCNSENLQSISQATVDRSQDLNSFEKSSVNSELVHFDGVTTGQDSSNCGSSFFKISSLAKMHVSVAEAT